MAPRTIPQRELRNDVGRILRQVDAGAEFEVTVRGRPVARLIPADHRPSFAPTEELLTLLTRYPVDPELLAAIEEARAVTDDLSDPWERWGA